jgi:hypothetical protein
MFVIITSFDNNLQKLFSGRVAVVKIKLLFLLQSKKTLPIDRPVHFFKLNELPYFLISFEEGFDVIIYVFYN